jgi:hypothetical protein
VLSPGDAAGDDGDVESGDGEKMEGSCFSVSVFLIEGKGGAIAE